MLPIAGWYKRQQEGEGRECAYCLAEEHHSETSTTINSSPPVVRDHRGAVSSSLKTPQLNGQTSCAALHYSMGHMFSLKTRRLSSARLAMTDGELLMHETCYKKKMGITKFLWLKSGHHYLWCNARSKVSRRWIWKVGQRGSGVELRGEEPGVVYRGGGAVAGASTIFGCINQWVQCLIHIISQAISQWDIPGVS